MRSLEPAYALDDDVAYTWAQKGKVTKCSIYLESAEAGTKPGTGAVVGCEANGVSSLAVPSAADPKRSSGTQDPKRLADVMDMFRKQSERAKASLPKKQSRRRVAGSPRRGEVHAGPGFVDFRLGAAVG